MEIKKYIADIVENGNEEDMNKLHEMLEEVVCTLKEECPDMYNYYKMCLYELAYGKTINEEMADKWVKNMMPVGKHWTLEETNEAMKSMNYQDNPIEFFTVANMMYNDYYNLVKENEEMALKLAHDWLNDEDAKDCKLYEYWKYVVKRD